jgi:hypothetical protein
VYPFPTLDHDQLLTLARKAHGAAQDHDSERLELDALHLFQALVDHLLAERPALLHATPGEADLLERGQQRVVDLVTVLAATATTNRDSCDCDRIAETLVAELTLQSEDERRSLSTAA